MNKSVHTQVLKKYIFTEYDMCPVQYYELYMSKLNPEFDHL